MRFFYAYPREDVFLFLIYLLISEHYLTLSFFCKRGMLFAGEIGEQHFLVIANVLATITPILESYKHGVLPDETNTTRSRYNFSWIHWKYACNG